MAASINPTTEKAIRAVKARWAAVKSGLLLDSFAKAALQGLLSREDMKGVDESRIARMAYQHAQAMLATRGSWVPDP